MQTEIIYKATLRSDGVESGLKGIEEAIDRTGESGKRTGKTVESASDQMISSFGQVKAMAAGLGISFGALEAIQIFRAAVSDALDFQDRMQNVASILGDSDVTIGELRQQVLGLGGTLGSAAELGDALYEALGAGVPAGEAVQFVAEAAKLAKGQLFEAGDATRLLATVMNAYGLEAKDAAHVSDVFSRTIAEGVVRGDELANALGGVISTSALAGVSIEEVSAAIAVMTKAGISADESTTALNAALLTFISPSEQSSKLAKELGIELSATALKSLGLSGALDMVQKATGGNIETINQLFNNVRAGKAVMALTGAQADDFTASIDRMKTTTGDNTAAFEKNTSTIRTQGEAVWNNLIRLFISGSEEANVLVDALRHVNAILEDPRAIKVAEFAFSTLSKIIEKMTGGFGVLWAAFEEGKSVVSWFGSLVGMEVLAADATGQLTEELKKAAAELTNTTNGTKTWFDELKPLKGEVYSTAAALGVVVKSQEELDKEAKKAAEEQRKFKEEVTKATIAITGATVPTKEWQTAFVQLAASGKITEAMLAENKDAVLALDPALHSQIANYQSVIHNMEKMKPLQEGMGSWYEIQADRLENYNDILTETNKIEFDARMIRTMPSGLGPDASPGKDPFSFDWEGPKGEANSFWENFKDNGIGAIDSIMSVTGEWGDSLNEIFDAIGGRAQKIVSGVLKGIETAQGVISKFASGDIVGGILQAGAALSGLIGRGRRDANEFVQGNQNQFGTDLAGIVGSASGADLAGLVRARSEVNALFAEFKDSADHFHNQTVALQALNTVSPLVTQILGDLDEQIAALGGHAGISAEEIQHMAAVTATVNQVLGAADGWQVMEQGIQTLMDTGMDWAAILDIMGGDVESMAHNMTLLGIAIPPAMQSLLDAGDAMDSAAEATALLTAAQKEHVDAVAGIIHQVTGAADGWQAMDEALQSLTSSGVDTSAIVQLVGGDVQGLARNMRILGIEIPPAMQSLLDAADAAQHVADVMAIVNQVTDAADGWELMEEALQQLTASGVDTSVAFRLIGGDVRSLAANMEILGIAIPPAMQALLDAGDAFDAAAEAADAAAAAEQARADQLDSIVSSVLGAADGWDIMEEALQQLIASSVDGSAIVELMGGDVQRLAHNMELLGIEIPPAILALRDAADAAEALAEAGERLKEVEKELADVRQQTADAMISKVEYLEGEIQKGLSSIDDWRNKITDLNEEINDAAKQLAVTAYWQQEYNNLIKDQADEVQRLANLRMSTEDRIAQLQLQTTRDRYAAEIEAARAAGDTAGVARLERELGIFEADVRQQEREARLAELRRLEEELPRIIEQQEAARIAMEEAAEAARLEIIARQDELRIFLTSKAAERAALQQLIIAEQERITILRADKQATEELMAAFGVVRRSELQQINDTIDALIVRGTELENERTALRDMVNVAQDGVDAFNDLAAAIGEAIAAASQPVGTPPGGTGSGTPPGGTGNGTPPGGTSGTPPMDPFWEQVEGLRGRNGGLPQAATGWDFIPRTTGVVVHPKEAILNAQAAEQWRADQASGGNAAQPAKMDITISPTIIFEGNAPENTAEIDRVVDRAMVKTVSEIERLFRTGQNGFTATAQSAINVKPTKRLINK